MSAETWVRGIVGLLLAGGIVGVAGLNGIAIQAWMRQRHARFGSRLGAAAYATSVIGAFSGVLAPVLGVLAAGLGAVAWQRRSDEADDERDVFRFPRDRFSDVGPELLARLAMANGLALVLFPAALVALFWRG